jgi:hypothetical protein
MPRSNSTKYLTPGGTTETEERNTFGPEITRTEFTPVSVESTGIVWIIHWSAIATRRLQFNYWTRVSSDNCWIYQENKYIFKIFVIGYITDKRVLPVTALNFGRTHLETSTGIHTLGRFECSGSMPFNDLPTSCKDLLFSGTPWKDFILLWDLKWWKLFTAILRNFPKTRVDILFLRSI